MDLIARSTFRSTVLLALLSLVTIFFDLGALPFVGADEPRYARIADEMSAAGEWVTPTLEDRPWLEKPPLYYWITIPFYRLAGVDEATARAGPALSALLAALAVWWLGRQLFSPLAGLLGASVLLTSLGFVAFARSASTDMPMTACLTVTLAIFGVAAARGPVPRWLAWLAWAFLGLSVLGKGPVSLVLAAGTVLVFWTLDERGGALRRCHLWTGLPVMALVTAPWFLLAYRENGWNFILVFVINHNLARYVTDIHHHSQPFFYYLPVLAGLCLPWTGWLLPVSPGRMLRGLRAWRSWSSPAIFLSAWVVVPVIFFSFSGSKLPGYVLPVLPPLCLLLGDRLAVLMGGTELQPGRTWTLIITSALLAAGIGGYFALGYLRPYDGAVIGAAVLAPGIAGFRFARRGRWSRAVAATVVQGAALVVAVAVFGFGAIGSHHSSREIAEAAMRAGNGNPQVITYRYFHHTLHYYTGYRVRVDTNNPAELEDALRMYPGAFVVTRTRYLQELTERGLTVAILARQLDLVLAVVRQSVDSPRSR